MNDDWIAITAEPLSVERAAQRVGDPGAGGQAIFTGTTRRETNAQGLELVALDYAAYEEMAMQQLKNLAAEARQRWPILKCAILHRTGRVAVGEASVCIAVSTAHRSEAFDACRWIIDRLKAQTTIWKQEIWADGERSWVHPEAQ